MLRGTQLQSFVAITTSSIFQSARWFCLTELGETERQSDLATGPNGTVHQSISPVTTSVALVTSSDALASTSFLVTTSKAPVTTSKAPVTTSKAPVTTSVALVTSRRLLSSSKVGTTYLIRGVSSGQNLRAPSYRDATSNGRRIAHTSSRKRSY